MDMPFWILVGAGVLFVGQGALVLSGIPPRVARQLGLSFVTLGIGVVLSGLAHWRNLGFDDWVRWAASAFTVGAALLLWLGIRHAKQGRKSVGEHSAQ